MRGRGALGGRRRDGSAASRLARRSRQGLPSRRVRAPASSAPARATAAPGWPASAPRPVPRRRATPPRPAGVDCRPACARRARARRGAPRRPAAAATACSARPRRQKRRAHRALHVEPRQRFVRARARRRPLPRRARSHREDRSRTAPTKTARRRRCPRRCRLEADGSTGPEIAGMTDCGSTWPKMLLAVPRFDCQSASSRGQIAGLRDADARGRRVHLLERRLDRRIVLDRVLQRLFQREDLRWGCPVERLPAPARPQARQGRPRRRRRKHEVGSLAILYRTVSPLEQLTEELVEHRLPRDRSFDCVTKECEAG